MGHWAILFENFAFQVGPNFLNTVSVTVKQFFKHCMFGLKKPYAPWCTTIDSDKQELRTLIGVWIFLVRFQHGVMCFCRVEDDVDNVVLVGEQKRLRRLDN